MTIKSPLSIVEDALAAKLSAETSLAPYNINNGETAEELVLPSIIVSCESAAYPTGFAQGLGNYMCQVSIGVFTQIDDTPRATHRAAVQDVLGSLTDLAGIKGVFTTQGDASCYDVTLTGLQEGRGERCFDSTLTFEVLICLSAV
jgi:hypothetical protein